MLYNFFYGGIIGIIYYLIICQISNNIFLENQIPIKLSESQQKSIMFIYFGGLIGYYIGSKGMKKENTSLKIGLYFGAALLVFNAIIVNWDKMDSQTKLLLLGINFGLLIWNTFNVKDKTKKLEKKNLKSSS
jgi:hypothetical protein